MEKNARTPGKLRTILRLFVVGLLTSICSLVVLVLSAPFLFPRHRGHELLEAQNNARQIGFALLEFEQSYGTYPNDSTATKVLADTSSKLLLGSSSSNDYFRQLMAAGITHSEVSLYARIPHSKKPDNIITGTHALAKGECGFSYLIGGVHSLHPAAPVVVTPLIPGKALFDYKAAKKNLLGKAVILFKDGSVQSLPIDKSGRVWINGKDLFDPTQPFWNGKAPIIKWPDL